MSKLEELIEQLCPNGVECVELSNILTIRNGKDYKNFPEGKYPVYGTGGIMTYIDRFAYDKPSVLIPRKGSLDKLYYVEEPFWTVDTIFYTEIDTLVVLPKFVFYYLQMLHLETLNKAGGVPSLTQTVLNKILIPLPPLPIQEEIVRILDIMTMLTAELTAELKARQKQYEYYRDSLLSFEGKGEQDGVRWMKLGDVLTIKNGKDYKCFDSGDIPVYGTGGIMTYIDTYAFDKPSVLIPRKGSLDKLYYVAEPFWTVDTIFYTDINCNLVIPKFVYYYLQTQHLENLNTAGGVPSLTQTVLNKVPMPVISLEEQQRIVDILDRFDKLCNDISEGLPAEIEARKKQYEYYRDKLLTFKEKEA